MPHLSPMQWLSMLISSWIMLSIMLMNINKMKNKQMMVNKKMALSKMTFNWKWFQDKNKL